MTDTGGAILFNPFDPEFRINPYDMAARLREEDPWHVSPLGMTVLTRHEDVIALLRHPKARSGMGTNNGEPVAMIEEWEAPPFLFMDPPDHTRLRSLVNKAFTPKTVEAMRPRIQEIVDELVEPAIEAGSMELIDDLAYLLPVRVIAEMLGVPPDDHETFKGWSKVLAKSLDPAIVMPPQDELDGRQAASDAFRDYFLGLIAERRRSPRDDLVTALVQAEDAGDKLTEQEVISTLVLLLIAGHETTVNLIGNGVLALTRDPAAQQQWRSAGAALSRSAVDELLRFDPPVQMTGRMAGEDIELPNGTLKQDQLAVTLLSAANRDPRVFPDPDRLVLDRAENKHVAFGFGIHHCLGAPLARIEGQAAIGTLLARTASIHRPTDDPPPYKENIVLRGLESLDLTLVPR